jgi:hypothetical protein
VVEEEEEELEEAAAECFAIREGDGEQDVVTVTQVREDKEEPDGFKKDRSDEDEDCGIVAPLTDAECLRIATISVEDEEQEDLTPTAGFSEFKDRGAPSALGGDDASGSQGAGSSTSSDRNPGLRFCQTFIIQQSYYLLAVAFF